MDPNSFIITGMIFIENKHAHVLIDSSARHISISDTFVKNLNVITDNLCMDIVCHCLLGKN